MARYCSPQLSVRTRLSPPYRVTIRLKVFQGRNSISWAKSVLPVFIGDSRDHPGSLLRLQIVDTAFCSETRKTPGAQSRSPSVNRTAVFLYRAAIVNAGRSKLLVRNTNVLAVAASLKRMRRRRSG